MISQIVKIKAPIKVKDFNGKNYYLIFEDANKVTHYFHKKLPETKGKLSGKTVVYHATEQGQYDGWSKRCKNGKEITQALGKCFKKKLKKD